MNTINSISNTKRLAKKKWLFVLPTDSLQGSEHIVQTVCTYIHEKKLGECRVIILCKKNSYGWEPLEDEFQIDYMPFAKYFFGLLYLIPFLVRRKIKPDYTFSSQTLINGSLGLAKRLGVLQNSQIIARESNSIFRLLSGIKLKIYTVFYHIGYSKTSLVICQTDLMKEQLVESLPNLSENLNIKTLPNPFDFEAIQAKSDDLPQNLKKRKFVVAAGRLAPVKGFDILIKAFNNIKKEYPDLHLVILGEGNERQSLEELVMKFNLEKNVHLPGYVNNVYRYFKEAHMCVISSHLEGFPNVLLQMMSQNQHIVSTTSAGGIKNIAGITTCKPGNQKKLEQAMLISLKERRTNNRMQFDEYLKSRSIENFYNGMMKFVK